ncbi:hypothetical protein ACFFWC_08840 [Plantactinospora siamensis]|uniref:Uncharacterized protein n=1 Tax=Plantactinospora siamensis TaxID=555372 RepID=A0ABV6P4F4_9ACTN
MTVSPRLDVLFAGEAEPFTSTIWFIEAPYPRVVDSVRRWRGRLAGAVRFIEVSGRLDALLTELEPWAMPSWKELIVATQGPWTALFSQGSDVPTFDVVSWELSCRSLRTSYLPHVVRDGQVVSYGDTAFWLTDGSRADLGPQHILRVIQATTQDDWCWESSGELQPFEEPELYTRRAVRDRLDLPALNRYCARLGIHRAEPGFYGPQATLVSLDTSGWGDSRTMPSGQWRAENL